LNRGNARRTVFHKAGDHLSILKLPNETGTRTPIRLLACCLMTNHFHLALWPRNDVDLSDFMQWLLTAHVQCGLVQRQAMHGRLQVQHVALRGAISLEIMKDVFSEMRREGAVMIDCLSEKADLPYTDAILAA